jgi:hypothetical protein
MPENIHKHTHIITINSFFFVVVFFFYTAFKNRRTPDKPNSNRAQNISHIGPGGAAAVASVICVFLGNKKNIKPTKKKANYIEKEAVEKNPLLLNYGKKYIILEMGWFMPWAGVWTRLERVCMENPEKRKP